MKRALAMVLPALAACACAPVAGLAPVVPGAATAPSGAEVAMIALRADGIRVAVGSTGDGASLPAVFAGPAAALLQRQVVRERRLHEHSETQVQVRAVVHWSATGAQAIAVVQDSGRQRLVGRGGASAWDGFVEQWQYTLAWSRGWKVWDAESLPPDQWWRA